MVTASRKNTRRPAPSLYRKFENAYFIALAPAIGGLILGWGFTDIVANRLTLLVVVFSALVKGMGMVLANGEDYVKTKQ